VSIRVDEALERGDARRPRAAIGAEGDLRERHGPARLGRDVSRGQLDAQAAVLAQRAVESPRPALRDGEDDAARVAAVGEHEERQGVRRRQLDAPADRQGLLTQREAPVERAEGRQAGLPLGAAHHLVGPAAGALLPRREALRGDELLAVSIGDDGVPVGGVAVDELALVDDEAQGVAPADVEAELRLDALGVDLRLPDRLRAVADGQAHAIGLRVHVRLAHAARDGDLPVAGAGEAPYGGGVRPRVMPVFAHAGPARAGPVGRAVPLIAAPGQGAVAGAVLVVGDAEGPRGDGDAPGLGGRLARVGEGAVDEHEAQAGQPPPLLADGEAGGGLGHRGAGLERADERVGRLVGEALGERGAGPGARGGQEGRDDAGQALRHGERPVCLGLEADGEVPAAGHG